MPANADAPQDARPVLGHVNLMVDTLIANASLNELRAFVRATLATSPPSAAGTFTAAARKHLVRANAAALPRHETLFVQSADGHSWEPAPDLAVVLGRCRMLYGAGLGVASLAALIEVVRGAIGIRWEEDSGVEGALAAVDADLTQAIQSAKEELDGGRVVDVGEAKAVREALHEALLDDRKDVEGWGGDFPFECGLSSVELWRM
ncbi:hypothetical protein BD413DRAFT_76742 [Trametes elegans]|nr:hypothetical protein BD413DRAFT_76742 [Trametes elegans]